ncbi:hypothetical protein LTR97_000362 [Elasticomyces elasticus]|uniref:Uncharacterized protein n=1 Tax=Elasticomyces elasticus TaxID=574655 RepID=A0AAN7ZWD1_9PEZI|nr:hypothetical protein LTR97_000362 [Elasticomyces elasticus]
MQDMQEVRYLWELCEASANPKSPGGTSDAMKRSRNDTEGQGSPEQPSMLLTPGSESRIDLWQQTGSFPYPDLQVFPPPQTHEYSKNELRLIHHLSSISNDLLLKGTSHLTVWTPKMSK